MMTHYEFFKTGKSAAKRKNELARLSGNFSVRVNKVDGGWEVEYSQRTEDENA